MIKINQKLIYNLLIRADILMYLNTYDKTELSSCCKYIYEKCTIIRLKNFKFGGIELQKYINNNRKEYYSGHKNYEYNLEYFDSIVNKRKHHLLCLTYSAKDYFLIEYFSLKFTNLSSLCLDYIVFPKNNLKNIIKSLQNLRSLILCSITTGYSKNDIEVTDFKFSKYLRELVWVNCSQFESDSIEYSTIKHYRFGSHIEGKDILDLSLNLVNNLKYLDWQQLDTDSSQLFNETIVNNPRLTTLIATLSCFNSDSFKLISTSSNLTKLVISIYGESIELDSSTLPKLPNIKNLEFYTTLDVLDTIDLLISICPNLEDIKLPYYEGFEQNTNYYLNSLENLKILTINVFGIFPSTLGSTLPESNLEKLKIYSARPLKLNFSTFINMKKLKCVINIHTLNTRNKTNKLPEYEDLMNWRMITYPTSIIYWKIK